MYFKTIINFFLHPTPLATTISVSISVFLLFIVFPLVNNAYKKKKQAENERIILTQNEEIKDDLESDN